MGRIYVEDDIMVENSGREALRSHITTSTGDGGDDVQKCMYMYVYKYDQCSGERKLRWE